MSKDIQVSLRIPNTKVRAKDEHGYPIDHGSVRFKKNIMVPAIPKPGESLHLPTASGRMLPATVVRADWNEELGLFVVACQYATRSISPEDYAALTTDADWRMVPLL